MSEASNDTEEIQSNSKIRLSIWQALIPIIALIGMLAYNVFIYGDDSLGGSNQFILLMGGAVAAIVGVVKGVKFEVMIEDVAKNIKATAETILILFMVGALAGTWLLSGIIPTMIYYGLQILNPTIFLAATVVICSVISIATGSSWTTSATVGIALIGIAEALGVSVAMTAGAVLSGGYFGDKLSPMSDTTNLAPAMAGTDLFTHIRYMTITTVPTIIVTLIAFIIIGLNLDTSGQTNPEEILGSIDASFNITPWLFLVPVVVIALIIKKTPPLIALLLGTLMAAGAALIFQPDLVQMIGGGETLNFETAYRGIIDAITVDITIPTENKSLQDLFSAGGMAGMLGTIWLIICAMVFGGIMDAIGALERISEALLNLFTSTFGLFFSTVSSCIVLNLTASDQYLAIVVPGKMFEKAYEKKGLAPENLSRTLEDSGTVTSVLIPWNTCGAYHSGVLGVPVADYFIYAIFNYLSPFVTLIFAAFNIKIKQLTKK
jgi:NhaC family Na+:H+ antiporter